MYTAFWYALIFDKKPISMTEKGLDKFLTERAYKHLVDEIKKEISTIKDEILNVFNSNLHASLDPTGQFETVYGEYEESTDNSSDSVPYIKLPNIILSIDNFPKIKKVEIKITINPCFGGIPNTKIIAIPETELISFEKEEILSFFKLMKENLGIVCNVLYTNYIKILKRVVMRGDFLGRYEGRLEEDLDKFTLHAYVIGSDDEAFRNAIQCSKDSGSMERIIESSQALKDGIDILKQVRIPQNGKSYHWFYKKIEQINLTHRSIKVVPGNFATEGLFAYLRKNQAANFIGVTFCNPRRIAKTLMIEAFRTV